MKRFLAVLSALAAGFIIFAGTYLLYSGNKSELCIDDLGARNITVEGSVICGEFKSTENGYMLSDYKYKVENGELYLTFYISPGSANALPENEDGYYCFSLDCGCEITKIWYEATERKSNMPFTKK